MILNISIIILFISPKQNINPTILLTKLDNSLQNQNHFFHFRKVPKLHDNHLRIHLFEVQETLTNSTQSNKHSRLIDKPSSNDFSP